MNALAIILARGGSKRLPRKNVRPFLGRPMLAYAIDAALESGCFSEVMVSTDDAEIAEIGRECGAVVPALRSAKNSTDHAGSEEAMHEVISDYRQRGHAFTEACAIYATAALTTSDHLRRGRAALDADPDLTAVLPIVRFSYPVQRALALRDGRVPMMHPEHYDSRSQDLEPAYHDAGQWYWLRTEKFLRTKELLGPNTSGVVISELETQDIDTDADWALAEMKFHLRQTAMLHD